MTNRAVLHGNTGAGRHVRRTLACAECSRSGAGRASPGSRTACEGPAGVCLPSHLFHKEQASLLGMQAMRRQCGPSIIAAENPATNDT